MDVLMVNGFADAERPIPLAVVSDLEGKGHRVSVVTAPTAGFDRAMSTEEWDAYHDEGSNMLCDEVTESADLIRTTDGLIFCYPTVCGGIPASVKNWLDRVLLPGVAFGFNAKGRVRPGLTHIGRLGVVTAVSWGEPRFRPGEGGRRSILWTIRLNCGLRCPRTFVSLRPEDDEMGLIAEGLKKW